MKNQLQRAFVCFLLSAFLFVLLFSLLGPKGKKIDLTKVDFSTSSSSTLFFNNMRSYFYDVEERKDANFKLYKIGSREKDSLSNKISFVLINNWLMNECYIRAESKYDSLTVHWAHEERKGTFSLEGSNSQNHYVFAALLFEQLDRKADFFLVDNKNPVSLSEEEKVSLKTTLKDYFKWVGRLR